MTVDRRRARGARNRAALVDSALELFARIGYDATTIDQIAAAAGVSRRTFANHFPSKDDVLFDGYAERLEEVVNRFRGNPNRSLWSGLADGSGAVARSILEQPRRYLERARLYADVPALRARMLRINEEWIDGMAVEVARRLGVEQGADVRPRLVATLVNGANRAAIEVWVASRGRADLQGLMTDAIELLRPTIDRIERGAAEARSDRAC